MNKIIEYANQMRQKPTAAERLFSDRVSSLDCHAQIVIGRFIADFLFPSKGIVVELDGGYHDEPEQLIKDAERDLWMRDKGLKVIRIPNAGVVSFPLSKITSAPLAPKSVSEWLNRAVSFSYQIEASQPAIPKTGSKGSTAAKSSDRIYGVYLPGGISQVVEGKPRKALRLVSNHPNGVCKRFKDHDSAQCWIADKIKAAKLATPSIPTSRANIESLRTPNGGFTRATLESLGVSWPPPKGWKKKLESEGRL